MKDGVCFDAVSMYPDKMSAFKHMQVNNASRFLRTERSFEEIAQDMEHMTDDERRILDYFSDTLTYFDKIDSEKQPNLIAYSLIDNANGDSWKEIKVVLNGAATAQEVKIKKGDWMIVAQDGRICPEGQLGTTKGGKITVAPYSALIIARTK
jgi:hypothetical protein